MKKWKVILAGGLALALSMTSVPFSGLEHSKVYAAETGNVNTSKIYSYEKVDQSVQTKMADMAAANTESVDASGNTISGRAGGPARWAFEEDGKWWHSRFDNWNYASQRGEDFTSLTNVFAEDYTGTRYWIGTGFGKKIDLGKLTYYGRPVTGQREGGHFKKYNLYVAVSDDVNKPVKEIGAEEWTLAIANGTFNEKITPTIGETDMMLSAPMEATHFKVEILDVFDAGSNYVANANQINAYAAVDISMDVSQYKSGESNTWTAPEQEGKLFAGWFTDSTYQVPYTEASGYAVPKFVDKGLLNVKAQIENKNYTDAQNTSIRFVSTIDENTDYQSVGFEISYTNGNEKTIDAVQHTAYKSLYAVGTSSGTPMTIVPNAENGFSADSAFFFAYNIKNIPVDSFSTTFTVTPYWVTMDGTKVKGQAVEKSVQEGIDALSNTPNGYSL